MKKLLTLIAIAAVSMSAAKAQTTFFWNGADPSASPAAGGTGVWNTTNAWRTGTNDGAQGTWAAATGGTNAAVLAGTAGTITLGTSGSTNFTGSSLTVNTTGYTITSSSGSRNLVMTGALTLADNVALIIDQNNTNSVWGFGSLSLGSGSTLTIQGIATANNTNRVNLTAASTTSSGGSIVLAGTAAGPTGFVGTASGVVLNTNILNDSATSATMLGSTSNNSLNYGGILSGSAHLQISAGQAGGAGTTILSGANDFTGDTFLNTGTNHVLRVGANNTLPSGTTVFFGQSAGGGTADNGGSIDLNGLQLAVGGIQSASSSRGIGNNTADAATLTIGKASGSNTFAAVIGTVANTNMTTQSGNISLVKVGNSTQLLSGANNFVGNITINGGELQFLSDASMGNAANDIIIDGGRLSIVNGETVTMSSTRDVFVGAAAGTSISTPGASTLLVYNGGIANKVGDIGSWAKQGAGTLELGGVSTYTGSTFINNGTLRLTTGDNRLPTGTVVSIGQAASGNLGTLNLNGFGQRIAGLQSTAGTNAGVNTNIVTSAIAAILAIDVANGDSYTFSDGTAANSGVISGNIAILKEGDGEQAFGGDNTYAGGTTVTGGVLRANSVNALGIGNASIENTGSLVISGGVASSTAFSAAVVLEENGTASYVKEFNFEENFANFGTVSSGDLVTSATLLAGQASSGGLNATITFDSVNPDPSIAIYSSVANLTGINGELFALQMTITTGIDPTLDHKLGWLNGSGIWVNAVEGNIGPAGALAGFAGDISFSDFLTNNGAFGGNYLGAWGIDTGNNAVWAVLDHNSTFAVIPEPSSLALLGLGLGYLALRRRRA